MTSQVDELARCPWAGSDPLYVAYHDEEWGVPCHDDRALFERLVLEGFQAGLSWLTILRKREGFRRAFDGFDPERVAAYGPHDVARLLADASIVRNRAKITASIRNAQAFLAIQAEFGSFDRYVWGFVGGVPLMRPAPPALADVPITTPESDALSKDLKRRGFTFVGSTICYAFMQSIGMVDDHVVGCFRAKEQGAESMAAS
ncbi:MAG TPA: DNA-3-methyladenine glycosylase I [Thermomicrobiales bacterium]|nr:DNA-3-methyladenine glycosylase I [Thermomicrobiales bacterium]